MSKALKIALIVVGIAILLYAVYFFAKKKNVPLLSEIIQPKNPASIENWHPNQIRYFQMWFNKNKSPNKQNNLTENGLLDYLTNAQFALYGKEYMATLKK